MPRKPTTNLNAALTANFAQPGYLVQLDLPAQTFRKCSLDVGFTYGGYSWDSADIQVDGISWDQGGISGGKLTLGDPDLVWWAYTLNLQMQDAPIRIWQVYAGAPGEAEPLWLGRIGRIVKGDMTVICDLVTDISRLNAPRRRVQNIIPTKYLMSAGRVIYIGNAQWTLERKQNG